MPTVSRLALTAAVAAAMVAGSVLAGPALQPASAEVAAPDAAPTSTPTSVSTPSSSPSSSRTTAPAPAPTAAPAPAPTPSATAAATAVPVAADPTLAEMNAARNHTMGSTIPRDQAPVGAKSLFQAQAAAQPGGVQGLDVSGWQVLTLANWRTIYANGARFVYTKATESTDYRSSQFGEQYADSYAAGLAHGAYHFAAPNTSSGATQANFFVSNGGGWSNDGRTLPPLLDIEYNPYGATCYGLSAAQMVSWIRDFSNTVVARTGRLPAIYSTTDWWTRCTGNTASFGANPLFIARYPSSISSGAGTLPAGWSRYTMWQYADAGIFPGDQDVFNGTQAQLTAYARGTVTGGTPVPPVPVVTPLKVPVVGVGDLNRDGRPDLIGRKPDGTLWFYGGSAPSTAGATPGYTPGIQIGSGWNIFDTILGPGDINGDGNPDLVARRPDGSLWRYASTNAASSSPTFAGGAQIGSGWNVFTDVFSAGDLNGDGKTDLIGRTPAGVLFLYAGTGSGRFASGIQISTGWNVFQQVLSVGDLNGDKRPDLVGLRSDGSISYYANAHTTAASGWFVPGRVLSVSGVAATSTLASAGDLNGDTVPDLVSRSADGVLTFIAGSPVKEVGYSSSLATPGGWNANTAEFAYGDYNGDGKQDVLAIRADGTLWLYPGLGSRTSTGAVYGSAIKIGNGWNVFSRLIAPGDFNGDRKPDLLGMRADGTLWLYAGRGSGTTAGFVAGVQIGHGWNVYNAVLGAGDFNGDGKADLLGRRADGSLWYYAGTGVANATNEGYLRAVQLGGGWQAYDRIIAAGDANGDGKRDILARKPDGSLVFFAGTGKPGATSPGYAPGTQIGQGWSKFQTIVAGQDANGDRIPDLVGIRADGSALLYPGTGTTGNSTGSFTATVAIGIGWQIFK
ncbi:GH25 family lysozyme [Leifsonia sp. NPDC058248]|uniref:GH25 family lysozyme n=1 Tax=Leifsonia sp. NPDC058248 TaxID=3346402 RepID=UPI0036D92E31